MWRKICSDELSGRRFGTVRAAIGPVGFFRRAIRRSPWVEWQRTAPANLICEGPPLEGADIVFNFVGQFCLVEASRQEAASFAGGYSGSSELSALQGGQLQHFQRRYTFTCALHTKLRQRYYIQQARRSALEEVARERTPSGCPRQHWLARGRSAGETKCDVARDVARPSRLDQAHPG